MMNNSHTTKTIAIVFLILLISVPLISCTNINPYENQPVVTEADNICSYITYDINKDGVPELFVRYGSCEADYRMGIYTYDADRDEVIPLETDIPYGHSRIASYPKENGALIVFCHMGELAVEKITMNDDNTLSHEDLYSETPDTGNYTAIDIIVSGSRYVDEQ